MADFLFQYFLFLAKTLTLSVSIVCVIAGILIMSAKQKGMLKSGRVVIENLSDKIKDQIDETKSVILSKKEYKSLLKEQTKETKETKKANKKTTENKPRLFILDFDGDIKASAVTELQHCLNAILPVLDKSKDEILLKLESGGGMVHAYGLAASQLDRIRQRGIKLTITIDKVAASGGYMMACVANNIVAAPFAIVGSIGVIGQLPNFHKLLEKHNIEFEQHTAGEYKRTLTMFGQNDDKARKKFHEELEVTQDLFKKHIRVRRPELDIEEVATGEHWYGYIALEKKLIDQIATSDEIILDYFKTHELYTAKYDHKKSLSEKFASAAQMMINLFKSNLDLSSKF